ELAVDLLEDPSSDLDALSESGGVLFESLDVGHATATARVRDVMTGLSADRSSKVVEIVVEGTSAGISQTARAVGRLPQAPGAPVADLDGSEFAILACGSLVFEGDAALGVWRNSPLAILAEPVAYGLASGSKAGISVSPNASLHGTVALSIGGFPTDVEMRDEQIADKSIRVPTAIHVPLAAVPAARETDGKSSDAPVALLDGYIAYDAMPEGDMRVPARAAATLRGVRSFDVAGNLHIERGARLRVEGETRCVVRGNLVIEPATIEVANGATLSILVLGDASIDGAYLGGERTNPDEIRDATGRAAYDGGASRVLLTTAGGGRIVIGESSVVKGEIYGPDATIAIRARSAVYGRILGRDVSVGTGCAVFYDPALDDRTGWTAQSSGLWTPAGTLQAGVREVVRLDHESLERFARGTGVLPAISPAFGTMIEVTLEREHEDREGSDATQVDTRKPRERAAERVARGLLRAIEVQRAQAHGAFSTLERVEDFKSLDRDFVSLGFDALEGVEE
ncbi:MAG: hypothetical protein ACKO3W_04620, partial [bacterium]